MDVKQKGPQQIISCSSLKDFSVTGCACREPFHDAPRAFSDGDFWRECKDSSEWQYDYREAASGVQRNFYCNLNHLYSAHFGSRYREV